MVGGSERKRPLSITSVQLKHMAVGTQPLGKNPCWSFVVARGVPTALRTVYSLLCRLGVGASMLQWGQPGPPPPTTAPAPPAQQCPPPPPTTPAPQTADATGPLHRSTGWWTEANDHPHIPSGDPVKPTAGRFHGQGWGAVFLSVSAFWSMQN